MLRETPGSLRIADVPSEYKSDVVSLELMSPDSSVKCVATDWMIGVRFPAGACISIYLVNTNLRPSQLPVQCLLWAEAAE
jgi:hypothetical protein